MRNTLLLLLFSLLILCNAEKIAAQSKTTIKNSFVIHGEDLKSNEVAAFTKSIENADFEQFRLQTETVLLKFKNGFTLELISAKDLIVRNIKADLDINSYTNYPSSSNYKYPLFEILPDGWVIAAAENTTK